MNELTFLIVVKYKQKNVEVNALILFFFLILSLGTYQ